MSIAYALRHPKKDVEVITAAFNWALEVHPGWTHFIPLTGQDCACARLACPSHSCFGSLTFAFSLLPDPLYGSAELARRIDATGQRTLVPSEELRCSSPNALAGQTFRGAAMYDESDHAAHSNDDVLMNEMQFPRMMCYLYPCSITNPSGGSGGKAAVETWQRSPWVFTGIKGAPPVLSQARLTQAAAVAFRVSHPLLLFCWSAQFCKSHTMSSGVFAREAVRFLVTDPSARSAYTFFHRAGLASVEHYWPSTLLSLRPDLTFLGNGTLMSCALLFAPGFVCFGSLLDKLTRCPAVACTPGDQGVGHDGTAATLDRVHNSFLTMAESGLIRAAFDGGALFARKFRTANSDVLDWIEALDGSAARAARARQRRQAAEAKR